MADLPSTLKNTPIANEILQLQSKLASIESSILGSKNAAISFAGELGKVTDEATGLVDKFNELSAIKDKTDAQNKELTQLSLKLKSVNMDSKLTSVRMKVLNDSFDRLGKAAISTGISLGKLGIKALTDSIKRVYEYQEKWRAAMGAFNMKLGGVSKGIGTASRSATQWEGTMHGLTDQFGQGIEMFAEFTAGFGKMAPAGKEFTKMSLSIARGFNLGAGETGKLLRSLENLGQTVPETKELFSNIVASSNASGLSVNEFTKELNDSREFMVRFGKAGLTTFVKGASHVKSYGVSIKSLSSLYDLTDTFEGATKLASKFNSVFGTSIDGLNLMLENDPAKRFETLRQSLVMQGKDMKSLLPSELKLIAESMSMSVEETEGMLKSGASYTEHMKKVAKEKEKQASADKIMHKALQATATTLFSFSQMFDKITVAIGKTIDPFLQLIGLSMKAGKQTQSFSGFMGEVTKRIVSFFNVLGKQDDFKNFMVTAAQKTKEWGKTLADYFAPDKIGKTVNFLVEKFKTFYSILIKIGKAWLVFKTISVAGDMAKSVASMQEVMKNFRASKERIAAANRGTGEVAEMLPAKGGMGFKGAGKMALKGLGGGLASAAGAAIAGGGAGEIAGSGIGGAIGTMIAPGIGTAIGGWLGGMGGKIIEDMIKGKPALSKLERAREEQSKKLSDADETLSLSHSRLELAILSTNNGLKNMEKYTSKINQSLEQKLALDEHASQLESKKQELTQKELEKAKKQEAEAISGLGAAKSQTSLATAMNPFADNTKQKKAEEAASQKVIETEAKRKALEDKLSVSIDNSTKIRLKEIKTSELLDRLKIMQASNSKFQASSDALKGQKFKTPEDRLKAVLSGMGDEGIGMLSEFKNQGIQGFATGGIVRSPTRALIGESGPEAVIPLRAMAKGRARQPMRLGGSSAQKLMNHAAGGSGHSGGNTRVTVTSADIYLDSRKVGRQLVRTMIEDVGE